MQRRGIVSTIVVFGSARVREGNRWYEAARALRPPRSGARRRPARRAMPGRNHVIATGGRPGIMEAANRGATEVGALTIGFNITLPHEQDPNAWSTPDLTFRFHAPRCAKMHLAMRAAALVVFPGGFGTLDELFEIMTLIQTGRDGTDTGRALRQEPIGRGLLHLDVMQKPKLHPPRGPRPVPLRGFARGRRMTASSKRAGERRCEPADGTACRHEENGRRLRRPFQGFRAGAGCRGSGLGSDSSTQEPMPTISSAVKPPAIETRSRSTSHPWRSISRSRRWPSRPPCRFPSRSSPR